MDFVNYPKLLTWITEREKARRGYEAKAPKPWTEDPIIQQFRFCNVRRQDDKVTKWLADNWYDYWESPHFVAAITLARLFNQPGTLKYMEYPQLWIPNVMKERVIEYRATGALVFNAAYIVSTCGVAMDKVDYVFRVAEDVRKLGDPKYKTLQEMYDRLTTVDGLGAGFLAGQVIADVKYTARLLGAPDWHSWCSKGPGSQRGLNRLLGHRPEGKWPDATFRKMIVSIMDRLYQDGIVLHAQDVQNCLCEFDKYMRALEGGRPKQRYSGTR